MENGSQHDPLRHSLLLVLGDVLDVDLLVLFELVRLRVHLVGSISLLVEQSVDQIRLELPLALRFLGLDLPHVNGNAPAFINLPNFSAFPLSCNWFSSSSSLDEAAVLMSSTMALMVSLFAAGFFVGAPDVASLAAGLFIAGMAKRAMCCFFAQRLDAEQGRQRQSNSMCDTPLMVQGEGRPLPWKHIPPSQFRAHLFD